MDRIVIQVTLPAELRVLNNWNVYLYTLNHKGGKYS